VRILPTSIDYYRISFHETFLRDENRCAVVHEYSEVIVIARESSFLCKKNANDRFKRNADGRMIAHSLLQIARLIAGHTRISFGANHSIYLSHCSLCTNPYRDVTARKRKYVSKNKYHNFSIDYV
jgi:hypothetical protein